MVSGKIWLEIKDFRFPWQPLGYFPTRVFFLSPLAPDLLSRENPVKIRPEMKKNKVTGHKKSMYMISNNYKRVLWTPTHCRKSRGRLYKTYVDLLSDDTRTSGRDLENTMLERSQ